MTDARSRAAVLGIWRHPVDPQPLGGRLTNTNFVVEHDGRRYVVRVGADIPVHAFAHEARWNDMLSRIEMHLRARRDVEFTIDGRRFAFAHGATIHTENSHKYGPRGGRLLLLAGGWTPVGEWVAPGGDFMLVLAEAQRNRFAP